MVRRRPEVIARRSESKVRGRSADSSFSSHVPAIAALNPSTVTAGDNGFTLTVNGSGFVSISTIQWNGSPLPTEYVSSSQLQAQVGAFDVANAGSASVTVVTPSPGGGASTALTLTVVPGDYPVPSILSISPNSVSAGSAGFTLDVSGPSVFNASSVVEWNGSPRPTTLYASSQLEVQISASDVANIGYAQITVTNPGPGGGTSNVVEFQILYQPIIVNQVTNDMVWDPLNQVIYISVPGTASTNANEICVLNPTTAKITSCQAAGSEPDVLAISDDSQFLYVGQDGTNSVQRFILPNLTPDISYTLGSYFTGESYYALDIQVAPGAPHTTAVSNGLLDVDPHALGPITIFDDSTPRPTSTPIGDLGGGENYASLQWGSDATELYAANSETTSYDFYTLTVSSSGVVLDEDYPSVFWNGGRIHYDSANGLIYSDDGYHAINPSTGMPAAIFELGVGGQWPLTQHLILYSF